MTTQKKNLLIGILILGGILLFWIATFYARAPRYFWHLGYQLFPACWSCDERIWTVDEGHSVRFHFPENWEIQQMDEALIIHPTEFVDKDMWFIVQPITLTAVAEPDTAKQLDTQTSLIFSDFQEYEVIEPAENIDFDGYQSAKTKVRAIPHIKVDEVLKATMGDFKPTYVQDHELFLVNYNGQDFLVHTIWRSGTPYINPWGYDQMQMILNSIQFE